LESHAVSRFFYVVIAPSEGGEQIVSAQIECENTSEAIRKVRFSHPKALEIYIRKLNEIPCV